MGSTIPLAKSLNLDKMQFPAALSEKFDGVPIKITYNGGDCVAVSRQDKPVPSVQEDMDILGKYLRSQCAQNMEIVGEVVQDKYRRAPFRETGGIVRRQEPQEGLAIMIFDGALEGMEDASFAYRMGQIAYALSAYTVYGLGNVEIVKQQNVATPEAFEFHKKNWMNDNHDAEGMVLRSYHSTYEPGKRQWGYQKVLNEPTIDLEVVSYEEAVCGKTGRGKGMIGRVNVSYRGQIIGCGPGKMTHKERVQAYNDSFAATSTLLLYPQETRIAEIKHKGDDSYDALRQPTFQRWRPDKDEPDA